MIEDKHVIERNTQQSIMVKIVQTTGDLPAMPQVASVVMEKLSDPNTTAKHLHDIISRDQALTARVLKVANSPFYGCSRSVTRLSDAVMVMGFNSIRSLVITSCLHGFFKSFGLAEKLLWEHTLVSASASKKIAAAIRYSKVEEAFMAGLLHDIGKIILQLKLPEKASLILQEVYNNEGVTFADVEQKVFGFDHAQVGKLIARKWNFAEEIEEAIGYHHQPGRATILPHLTYIVHLANACCHKLEIGPTRNPGLNLMDLESARVLNISENTINTLLEEISAAMAAEQGMLFS